MKWVEYTSLDFALQKVACTEFAQELAIRNIALHHTAQDFQADFLRGYSG